MVLLALAKKETEKGSEPTSYFSARKNACLFKILLNLTLENYCFLFCEYQSLVAAQPALKTVQQISKHFGQI